MGTTQLTNLIVANATTSSICISKTKMRYPSPAVAKPRMTHADTWKKRPIVLRYWEYKDSIRTWAWDNQFSLGDEVWSIFYIPMPKSWSKKKKDKMRDTVHKQRPDIDNLLKGLMDALLEEDSHIHTVWAKKIWADQGSIEFYKLSSLSLF